MVLFPLLAIPIGIGIWSWKALVALHWHPALILLAIVVTAGILIAVVNELSGAFPRVVTAIGVLYCTAMYGLAGYSFTKDPIWAGVIAILAALLCWQPVAALVSRRAVQRGA
jgi:hypothetical protein